MFLPELVDTSDRTAQELPMSTRAHGVRERGERAEVVPYDVEGLVHELYDGVEHQEHGDDRALSPPNVEKRHVRRAQVQVGARVVAAFAVQHLP
eukprot:scaffold21750_cov52-Phaeocystis_antarctica.AAC.6